MVSLMAIDHGANKLALDGEIVEVEEMQTETDDYLDELGSGELMEREISNRGLK